ncbi:solute carrier family 22 member 2-like isoform X2 [Centropristis striata]|uniref:solute carrier family 22 member 2-like isoform X2 n=1 Tax=Centropristis striata TaxID=184440 RepID=UPI0027E12315|nr:solute carrier family 22 member 2-like isoform X2 [Centropristis striata]
MRTFDDLLEEAGGFGRSQKRIFLLLCMVSLPFAGVYVGIVFQGFTPDHWCRDSAVVGLRRACSWSLLHSRRLTLPPVNSSAELQHSSCEQYEVDWNNTEITCDTQELNLSEVALTTCKDGWEYQYEGRKSFVTEFDLVCSDGWYVDMYQASLNVGFLVGSFAFGFFADRFGRKISFLVSNVLNVLAGMALALTPNYVSILVLRSVFGFGAKGGWMSAYVLVTEIVGVEYRRTVGILYEMFFSVGVLILPLLAYFITDWRWLQVVITAPYILFLSYFWFIPESPRWLISQNKSSKALEITEAIAKENNRKLKNTESLCDDEGECSSASLLDLVRTPNMRKNTLILMFNWFTSAVVYQGLIMRVGITGGNVYLDFLLSALVEFPSAFLILLTIERIGRRVPFAAANIVAGASCLITAFIPDKPLQVCSCLQELNVETELSLLCSGLRRWWRAWAGWASPWPTRWWCLLTPSCTRPTSGTWPCQCVPLCVMLEESSRRSCSTDSPPSGWSCHSSSSERWRLQPEVRCCCCLKPEEFLSPTPSMISSFPTEKRRTW